MFRDREYRQDTEQEKKDALEVKKAEVISKFSEKVTNGDFMLNPTLQVIVRSLIYGNNPYSIIEQLLVNQEQLIKEMHEMQKRNISFKAFFNPEIGEPYKK